MTLNKPTNGSGPDSRARTVPALFENANGHLIGFEAGELVVIEDGDENAIWIPVSAQGLKLLGLRLLTKAAELEGGA